VVPLNQLMGEIMRKISKILVALFSIRLLLVGVAGAAGMPRDSWPLQEMEGHYYFLGINLHADHFLKKVSSVNYQLRGELIPWGTEVRIVRVGRNHLVFEDVAKHQRYSYEFHWKTKSTVPLVVHVQRVFLDNVDELKKQVEGMSEVDKDGVYEGRVKLGMSRDGVLIAIGYPPEFANRDELMSDRDWLYWASRYSKMVVSFGRDGLVTQIVGED